MITLSKISKAYAGLAIYTQFSLHIKKGIITSILGPSGYGKSTLLNMIAGSIEPDEGEVRISEACKLGYLLQENVMLPWRNLKENIRLGLEIGNQTSVSKENNINDYISRFGLTGFEEYYPETLSGGMKQRAALIRCLITEPDLILLDEPFSNLDFDIKLKIQIELLAYQQKTNATVIIVTHDIEDAIALSDELVILTGKPASIKKSICIDLGLTNKDPVLARKSAMFPGLFSKVWDELKYLNNY